MRNNTITPTTRLVRKINREFSSKRRIFIGDIPINDEEYDLLLKLFVDKSLIIIKNNSIIIDPIYCVALVQIGIRNYDRNFWEHVKNILQDYVKWNPNYQGKIGAVFIKTMTHYNRIHFGLSEIINSILVHSFVTNNYASRFFDFLFAFYRIDLERDLTRFDKNAMNSLIDIMTRNDNTGRTYFLVKQTADAIANNLKGSKLRIRRYLKLIDKAFWGDPLPETSSNRITRLFLDWVNQSNDFQKEKREYLGHYGKRAKSFSTPYIFYSPKDTSFSIVLPSQIIKYSEESDQDLYWQICIDEKISRIDISLNNEGVTGYKTDRETLLLSKEDLFRSMSFSIMNGTNSIRKFRLPAEKIRFFDNDGNYVKNDSLSIGDFHSFAPLGFKPDSSSIIYESNDEQLIHTVYNFVEGDIIVLPDGRPISIDKKIKEGILPRGYIKGLNAKINDDVIPVYSDFPQILVRTLPQRAKGTAVIINGTPYRLYNEDALDDNIKFFEIKDRSGEYGYLFNPKHFGYNENGQYKITIDIPNDNSYKSWSFFITKDFTYHFEDAPYIFKRRGTLCYPLDYSLEVPSGKGKIDRGTTENTYNFDIIAGVPAVKLIYNDTSLYFDIPALSYRFAGEEWQTNPHMDVWHSDFNPLLEVDYHQDSISFCLDEDDDWIDEQNHSETFKKIKSKNLFECDLNRFNSWFGKSKMIRQIYLLLPDVPEPIPFIRVVTQSYLSSGMLMGDVKANTLSGVFDIIGKADYYADLIFENEIIAEKTPLKDGKFTINANLNSGIYTAIIYESEISDSGFGDPTFDEIGRRSLAITNPNDLRGRTVEISSIVPYDHQDVYFPLKYSYKIIDLSPTEAKSVQENSYDGKMIVRDPYDNRIVATFRANIEFFDIDNLNNSYITYYDPEFEEFDTFLYDSKIQKIVKRQSDMISSREAYRRYEPLFPEDYIFKVVFTEHAKAEKSVEIDDKQYNNLIQIDKKQSIFKNKQSELFNKKIETFDVSAHDTGVISIDKTRLSPNCKSILRNNGIKNIYALFKYDLDEGITNIYGINKDLLSELCHISSLFGYSLRSDNLLNDNSLRFESENVEPCKDCNDSFDQKEAKIPEVSNNSRLIDIGLNKYTCNILARSGISTLGDITDFIEKNGFDRLKGIQGLSDNTLKGLKRFLAKHGFLQ